jgi:hypothetical protein
MISFREIQTRVCRGFDWPSIAELLETDEGQDTLDEIKAVINDAYEKLLAYKQAMDWQKRDGVIVTKASYTTGTVTVTQGDRTITGAGTTFTRDMVGQKIQITNSADTLDPANDVYRITAFVSATELTIDIGYIPADGSGLSYEVFYDTYVLPPDFSSFEVARRVDTMVTYHNDDHYLRSSSSTDANPYAMMLLGLSVSPFYDGGDTATVSITQGLKAAVGVNTAWDSTMVEKYVRFGNHGKLYRIDAVSDANNLTIDKAFAGDTVTAGTHQIEPPGMYLARFVAAPTVARMVPYRYWPKFIRLESDDDVPIVPNEHVLVDGAKWLWHDQEGHTALSEKWERKFYNTIERLEINKMTQEQACHTEPWPEEY